LRKPPDSNTRFDYSSPGTPFFAQQGWIILFQVFVSLFAIIVIYRNRAMLKESKRWHFLARRTFSAGIFLGYMATALIYEFQGAPAILKQVLSFIAAISFARLLGGLIEASWKRQFIYGLMILLIVSRLIETFRFPLPLFRLYTVATALVGLLFCFRWARENVRLEEPRIYPWGLRVLSLFFAIIVIAELLGKAPLPFYLLTSFMRSAAAVLIFALFMYMIRGGLEWLFRSSPMRKTSSLYSDTAALVRRIGLFIDIVIWGLVVVPAVFVIWGAYDSIGGAVQGLLGLGFNLGTHRVSLGLLIIAAGFVYISFLLSWILQNLLVDKVLIRRKAEMGVRVSTKRLVHYVLITLGFLLALSTLGLELTKLTIMLSALGVGIGFGLQGIVNNFVSGLILLFERPVRVGDYIEVTGNWCEIQKIGLRATTVQTFDQADVIIPNADLVSNQVTNWTLRNRRARLIIPVGVAYGSDIPLVIETLKASADPHPMVAKNPAPQVLFLSFGESSLNLELRVWVLDVDHMLTTQSELHQEIDRRFREANIEIAFPQRDLHFRGVDNSLTITALPE
jgi:small-conductance mechanosensitive channel